MATLSLLQQKEGELGETLSEHSLAFMKSRDLESQVKTLTFEMNVLKGKNCQMARALENSRQ